MTYDDGSGCGIYNSNGSLNFDYSKDQHAFLNQPDNITHDPPY